MKKLSTVLQNQEENYILPFLWMHGESADLIRKHIEAIYTSGCRAMCLEPRPHPDFAGENWFRDVRIVLEEAKQRQMKVWLFDDSHFPTGYANGEIARTFPHLRKKLLRIGQIDFVGPQKAGNFLIKWQISGDREKVMQVGSQLQVYSADVNEDKLLGVVAARIIDFDTIDASTLVDLSSKVRNDILEWDLPRGQWRLFTLVETFYGGEASTEGYLNPIDPESTQVLIDTVYERHYHELGDYFGNTIAGFFSDEPRFGNVKGPDASIGRKEMLLPWRSDLPVLLKTHPEENIIQSLPLLAADAGNDAHRFRYRYMDVVSSLYSVHFSRKLGEWCEAHGVEYIGHVIEDNNAHARLGYGAGHFSRALAGQNMSGIDVVLNQLIPGMDTGHFHTFTSSGWDGEFFHYGLAKMGASVGHLSPEKQGRTLCELFGAFGFSEGLRYMKWMSSHMLVRGVNHFVPHAFNMAPFPDLDCPPHFYAQGHDPQFRYTHHLMRYLNKSAELLSDGTHIASVALLYHAEAEWSGEYMAFQKPAKELTCQQIDFDIVPIDLLQSAQNLNNQLAIGGETFQALVIPWAQALPERLQSMLATIEVPVFFIDGIPQRTSEGGPWTYTGEVVALEQLAETLRNKGFFDISVTDYSPWLRSYHYQHTDGDIFMFHNESVDTAVITTLCLHKSGWLYNYDPFINELRFQKHVLADEFIPLSLPDSGEVFWIVLGNELKDIRSLVKYSHKSNLKTEWRVSKSGAMDYPVFSDEKTISGPLPNLDNIHFWPGFSGTFRYETTFDNSASSEVQLELTNVYEIAQVFINDINCGVRFNNPYLFDVTKSIVKGTNKLVIEVTNTLGTEQKDYLSQYRALQPSGFLGECIFHLT